MRVAFCSTVGFHFKRILRMFPLDRSECGGNSVYFFYSKTLKYSWSDTISHEYYICLTKINAMMFNFFRSFAIDQGDIQFVNTQLSAWCSESSILNVVNQDWGLMITILVRKSVPRVSFKTDFRRGPLIPNALQPKTTCSKILFR